MPTHVGHAPVAHLTHVTHDLGMAKALGWLPVDWLLSWASHTGHVRPALWPNCLLANPACCGPAPCSNDPPVHLPPEAPRQPHPPRPLGEAGRRAPPAGPCCACWPAPARVWHRKQRAASLPLPCHPFSNPGAHLTQPTLLPSRPAQTCMESLSIGAICTLYQPAVVIEAVALTAAIVIGLTLYTFYATRKGADFRRGRACLLLRLPRLRHLQNARAATALCTWSMLYTACCCMKRPSPASLATHPPCPPLASSQPSSHMQTLSSLPPSLPPTNPACSFMGPMLFGCLMAVLVWSFIQLIWPPGPAGRCAVGVQAFCCTSCVTQEAYCMRGPALQAVQGGLDLHSLQTCDSAAASTRPAHAAPMLPTSPHSWGCLAALQNCVLAATTGTGISPIPLSSLVLCDCCAHGPCSRCWWRCCSVHPSPRPTSTPPHHQTPTRLPSAQPWSDPDAARRTVFSLLVAMLFCAYIVYDTYLLMERHSLDEYVWASVALYLVRLVGVGGGVGGARVGRVGVD